MANKTWVGTTADYGTASNWSPSGVPQAGDDVRIPAGSGNIDADDQSAVAIGDFIVEEGYTGTIGSASGGYLEIDPDRFVFHGTGLSYIDIGSAAISPEIYNSATAATGKRGLYLKGSAIATLSVSGGRVGLAVNFGETSTATTVRVVGSGASVWVGAGTTLTNFQQTAGDNELRCAASDVKVYGGNFASTEEGAITTMTVYGGNVYPESTGTITTLTLHGGTTDFTGSGAARTVTTLNQNAGSVVVLNPAVVTVTTRAAPDAPAMVSVSALN